MVFFNKTVLNDIENIFIGLLKWHSKINNQKTMSFEEVLSYGNDLRNVGNSLDKLTNLY